MKHSLLLLHLLKSYFYRGKGIFAVFAAGCVLTGFSVYLIAGGFTNYFAEKNSTNYIDCRYTVDFDPPQSLSALSVYDDNVFFREKRYYEAGCRVRNGEETLSFYTVLTAPYQIEYMLPDQGRLSFTEEEVANAAPVAIVSPDFYVAVGDEITVEPLGTLQVIGVPNTPFPHRLYIPYTLYEASGFPVDSVVFMTPRSLTLGEQIELETFLQSALGSGTGYVGAHYSSITKEALTADLIGITAVFLIITLLFLYLMSYIAEKNRPFYALMGTLGASKMTIFFFLVWERFVIVTASMTVAALLHVLTRDLFHRLLLLPPCQLTFSNYLLITMIAALVSLLAAIPFAAVFLKGKYSAILKKSE